MFALKPDKNVLDELSFVEFERLAEHHQRIAVYREISGDCLTPIRAYQALAQSYNDMTLLESHSQAQVNSRYSFLCLDTELSISAKENVTIIEHEGRQQITTDDPFSILRHYQRKLTAKLSHALSGFVGGLVGFLSYDAIRLIENIPYQHQHSQQVPLLFFRSYTTNVVFDHQAQKIVISTLVDVNNNTKEAYAKALMQLQNITELLQQEITEKTSSHFFRKSDTVTCNVDDSQYKLQVEQAKQYLQQGDIFQVVLARKFTVKTAQDPFTIYRSLRLRNPSPYMFYLPTQDFVIAGTSPEKLVSLHDGVIESCPLAGTRPYRDHTTLEHLADELLNDPKEVAEHIMLVDLARNDVGKVAAFGSVGVKEFKKILKCKNVMHISSRIQGQIAADEDALSVLKAAFPAGTLSGAPKIRAMEIIDELETEPRGIYGGAICAIDSNGNLDSCITIRTAIIRDGEATVTAGAGIVLDSDSQSEANETRHKASAVLQAIMQAGEA